MMIDCDSCTVRGAACTDCVVTFLTIPVRPGAGHGPGATGRVTPSGHAGQAGHARHIGHAGPAGPPGTDGRRTAEGPVDLDDDERAAIDVLARSGLVPPLRMVRAM